MGRWDNKIQLITMPKNRYIQILTMIGIIGLCTGIIIYQVFSGC